MSYRVKRGDQTDRTPFTTQWYIVDESGRTGMESLPRHQRRGHDDKRSAVDSMQRLVEREAAATVDTVGELTSSDERVLRRLASGAVEHLRVGADVPEEQVERLEAHGKVRRETRVGQMPGRRWEYEVVVPS